MTLPPGLLARRITPLCQLQDLGRSGYQRFGVSRSGAMDPYSLRLANILAGNPQGEACLEFALAGAAFEVTAKRLHFAFVGNFPVAVNDEPLAANASYTVTRGERLEIGASDASAGTHGYLAVRGGFAARPQLGSVSTHLRSGIGGFGEEIRRGLVLPTRQDEAPLAIERQLPDELLREPGGTIRAVPGPQAEHFAQAEIERFFGTEWKIAPASDRMGFRLDGAAIEATEAGSMISEAVSPGSVQVPAGGQPIVLMADCGTVGGYPKIATVITVDRGRLAQLRVGAAFRFEETGVENAKAALSEEHSRILQFAKQCQDERPGRGETGRP